MFKIRFKKRITIFILTSFMLFFLSDYICFGKENVSQNERMTYYTEEYHKSDVAQEEKDKDYIIWKQNYEEAQKTIKKSKMLNTIGLVTIVSSGAVMYLARKKVTKGGGTSVIYGYDAFGRPTADVISFPEVEDEEYNTELVVAAFSLLAVGTGLLIAAKLRGNKAKKQKKALEEEGKIRGYFDLKLDPITKSVVISYSLKF